LIFHLLRSFFTLWHKLQFVFQIEIHCPLTHLWYYPRMDLGIMEARGTPPKPPPPRGPVPLCFVNCYNNIQFNRIWVLLGLPTKARILCWDSFIEYSSLKDFGPYVMSLFFVWGFLKDDILACVETWRLVIIEL
jgi:hypothetical protein